MLKKLSILVPVYNESRTIDKALKRLLDVDFECETEVIVIDDGSADGSAELIGSVQDPRVKLVVHEKNQGKSAAIRTGLLHAEGDYAVIFDGDLEYYPEDLPRLIEPVTSGDAEVVYGTRTFGSHTAYSFWFVMGNKAVTMMANLLFNCWISDLETCYKLVPTDLLRKVDLRSSGFGMEAEVTGKLLRAKYRPYEVPIRYKARSREEGKKLTWKDGVQAMWILLKIRLGLGGGPKARS